MRPTGPGWAPCWPHEICYLGTGWVPFMFAICSMLTKLGWCIWIYISSYIFQVIYGKYDLKPWMNIQAWLLISTFSYSVDNRWFKTLTSVPSLLLILISKWTTVKWTNRDSLSCTKASSEGVIHNGFRFCVHACKSFVKICVFVIAILVSGGEHIFRSIFIRNVCYAAVHPSVNSSTVYTIP